MESKGLFKWMVMLIIAICWVLMQPGISSAQLFCPKYNSNGDRVGLFGGAGLFGRFNNHPKAGFASGGGCSGYNAGASYYTTSGGGCTGGYTMTYGSGCTGGYGGTTYSYSTAPTGWQQVMPRYTTSNQAEWPTASAYVNGNGEVVAFIQPQAAPPGTTRVDRGNVQQKKIVKPTEGSKVMPACGNPDCTCENCTCVGECHCKNVMPAVTTSLMQMQVMPTMWGATCVGPDCPNCNR